MDLGYTKTELYKDISMKLLPTYIWYNAALDYYVDDEVDIVYLTKLFTFTCSDASPWEINHRPDKLYKEMVRRTK